MDSRHSSVFSGSYRTLLGSIGRKAALCLGEGYSLDLSGLDLEQLYDALCRVPGSNKWDAAKGKARREAGGWKVHLARELGKLVRYSPTDSLSDFLEVEPFNHAERLFHLPRDERSLTAVRDDDALIYYGFGFRRGLGGEHHYRDKFTARFPLKAPKASKAPTDPQAAAAQLRAKTAAKELADINSKLPEFHRLLDYLQRNPKSKGQLTVAKDPLTGRMPEVSTAGSPQDFLQHLQWYREEFEDNLRAKVAQLERVIQAAPTPIPGSRSTPSGIEPAPDAFAETDAAGALKYIKTLRMSFAQILKYADQTGDPEIVAIRDQFIRLAVDNFARQHSQEYDLVVYPPSASGFNRSLATQMARALGAGTAADYGLPELFSRKGPADISVDRDELKARYGDLRTDNTGPLPQYEYEAHKLESELGLRPGKLQGGQPDRRKRVDGTPLLTPEEPYGPLYPPEQRTRKLKGIKGIRSGDKRRYVDHIGLGDLPLEGLNILVVDDNVHHRGTLERVYKALKGRGAGVVNMYSPLFLGNDPA